MEKHGVAVTAGRQLVKVVLPAVLGAIGGLAATFAPAYFSAFCGV